MINIKILFFSLLILPFTIACGNNKDNKQTKVKVESKVVEQKESGDIEKVEITEIKSPKIQTNKDIEEAKKEHKILNKLGINTTKDGKIVIEPKKTKEFFKKLAKILTKEGEEFKSKNDNIKGEDIGVKASKDKIIIDTKKTKNFLEKLSKDLENMAKDIEKSVDEF